MNENGGIPIAAQLSVNLRNLLRLTSNFLNGENFTMLLSAVRAVNGYNPEKGPDLEVGYRRQNFIVALFGFEPVKLRFDRIEFCTF